MGSRDDASLTAWT